MHNDITYRPADINDIDVLCEKRKIQLIHEGMRHDTNMDRQLKAFFEKNVGNENFYGIVACDADKIVATGAVLFYSYPPSYVNLSGESAYIANIFTEPAYRKQGIATHILALLQEHIALRGVSYIYIDASVMGRPLYEKNGFVNASTFMCKNI